MTRKAPATQRGHWPQGKRRNQPHRDWAWAVAFVSTLLCQHRVNGVRSVPILAAQLKVSTRTVRRWLASEDIPAMDMQRRFIQWAHDNSPTS